jgi:hypothetical protein
MSKGGIAHYMYISKQPRSQTIHLRTNEMDCSHTSLHPMIVMGLISGEEGGKGTVVDRSALTNNSVKKSKRKVRVGFRGWKVP